MQVLRRPSELAALTGHCPVTRLVGSYREVAISDKGVSS